MTIDHTGQKHVEPTLTNVGSLPKNMRKNCWQQICHMTRLLGLQ